MIISVKNVFNKFCELVKPHLDEDLYQNILQLENEILEDPLTKKRPAEEGMTVIIHGDYRTNNILFKYDKRGIISQVKLIDWQFCREANPVLDLINFFVTSVPIHIFQEDEEALKSS